MAIDYGTSLNTGAPDITYTGNEGPRSPQQQQQMQMQQQQQQMKMASLMQEYKDYVMQQQSPMAYGGTAHPTYTQSRRQRINAAGGGIMGSNAGSMLVAPTADGSRPGYGWLSDIKDKFVEDIIPNELKSAADKLIPNELKNPAALAAIAGLALNQFGIPFTGKPGDRMGQNWMGDLIDKDLVYGAGGEQTGDLGFNLLKPGTWLPSASENIGKIPEAMRKIPGGIGDLIEKIPGGIGDVVGGIGDFLGPSDIGGRKINWKTPLAIGLGAGAIQAAMPQSQLPQDTSGINIGDIRSRAKTGSDPGLHFLPPPEATTAYAQGGRTGYAGGGGILKILKRLVTPETKRFKKFNYSQGITDDYKMDITEIMEEMSDEIYGKSYGNLNKKQQKKISDAASEEFFNIQAAEGDAALDRFKEGRAQGGRIGYQGGGAGGEGQYGAIADVVMLEIESQINPTTGTNWSRGDTGYSEKVMELTRKYMAPVTGGRIGAQEGGLMDLGGMEKDYRQEGGFVPIGGEERADDVPARLSKNEFVFTADAVRAAGGGDIDAGAEVMENVMENLEQGGQISEESQGLEGARDMFATAQRLEGVM